ncbi:MAG: ribose transport system permease protein [Planctomycetaceae bacterium]|jgi:ribose transport system permease protein
MKKNLGILVLLTVIFVVTALCNDSFLSAYNLFNVIERASLYGIIGIGVAFVIITGGIDLSIGSFIGLVASTVPFIVVTHEMPLAVGLLAILAMSLAAGFGHGLLITKLKLQPFVVTLCGLMIYRGLARWITSDKSPGFGPEQLEPLRPLGNMKIPVGTLPVIGEFSLPIVFFIFLGLAIAAAVFLNKTIYGRYLLALGRNEQAARYSGIRTDRMTIVAYVLCSLIAGLGGLLFAVDQRSVQPDSFGNFYELYAIAAAVLGGCSLRGGEGSILGIALGATLMRLLMNSIQMIGIADTLEPVVLGVVILVGVIVDEIVKRIAAKRRASLAAKDASAR